MSFSLPVLVPLENVNDEAVTLLRWLVADRSPVTDGQAIAEIETSKACVEIASPGTGFLHHLAAAGTDVAVGGELARVTDSGTTAALDVAGEVSPPKPETETGRGPRFTPLAAKMAHELGLDAGQFRDHRRVRQCDIAERLEDLSRNTRTGLLGSAELASYRGATRFSTRALALLKAHGFSPDRFEGQGMVRERDVQALLEPSAPVTETPKVAVPAASTSTELVGAAGVAVRSVALSRRKRTEGQQLAAGLRHTVPSTVVVACPTQGLRVAAMSNPVLQGSATPLILFEAARLLRQHPELNGYWSEGQAHLYEAVHLGFAVDAGHGLKVPVIKDADRKPLPEIAAEFHSLILAYLENRLTPAELSGGTFTVTDLSSEGVTHFVPLISRGQAAILGVGTEQFLRAAQGSPPSGTFSLILTFDHQLSDGRQAARFLTALRDRMAAYEQVLLPPMGVDAACTRCFRTTDDLSLLKAYLVPTLDRLGGTRPVCTLCMEGW